MKSAIEKIYDGEVCNQALDFGEEYRETRGVTEKKEKVLLEFIKDDPEAVKAFKEYQNAETDSSCIETLGYYKEGFRNGFRIALDALGEG